MGLGDKDDGIVYATLVMVIVIVIGLVLIVVVVVVVIIVIVAVIAIVIIVIVMDNSVIRASSDGPGRRGRWRSAMVYRSSSDKIKYRLKIITKYIM